VIEQELPTTTATPARERRQPVSPSDTLTPRATSHGCLGPLSQQPGPVPATPPRPTSTGGDNRSRSPDQIWARPATAGHTTRPPVTRQKEATPASKSPRHRGEETSSGDAADHQEADPSLLPTNGREARDPRRPLPQRRTDLSGGRLRERRGGRGGEEGRRRRGGRVSPPGRLEEATRGAVVAYSSCSRHGVLFGVNLRR
jgi:hypothetical protein